MFYLELIFGLIILCGGAVMLTNSSAAVASRLHVSEFVIGLTIIAIGTSLPELTVSISSSLQGEAEVGIGNVIGSNIFNILLILGICSLIKPIELSRHNVRIDIPLCLIVTIIAIAMLYNGILTRIEAIALFIGYIASLIYSNTSSKEEDSPEDTESNEKFNWFIHISKISIGLSGLIFGANFTLEGASEIARSLNVSEAVIAITIIAGGTSLPELAAGIAAIRKGHYGLLIGNIIGSNMANILLILGCSGIITPLSVGNITPIDLFTALLSMILLFVFSLATREHKISRLMGVILLIVYGIYIANLTGIINLTILIPSWCC